MAKIAKKEVKKTEAKNQATKKDDYTKLFAFLATFLSIIGFVIALLAKKDNQYIMYYAKQSLVVFIVAIIVSVADTIITGIFNLIWLHFIGQLIIEILGILVFILWIISWVYALSGEMKEVPIVGKYGNQIKL
ncbi:MAG: hypothetical protein ABIH72_01075 [archaeon]